MDTSMPGAPSAAAKAPLLSLDARMHAAAALHAIVENALQHLRANEQSAAAGDVEGVHQLRVAVRRLRAALALFAELLEPHAAERFETELRRIGRVFGEARDWDVFCTDILPQADAGGAESATGLLNAAAPFRDAAHARLRAELAGPVMARLLDGIADWVDPLRPAAEALDEQRWQHTLANVAPDLLNRLDRTVERRGRHLRRLSDEELHRLRKSIKKLRYGVSFLEDVYGHKATRPFRRRCKRLQELLGRVNDAVAAQHMAAKLDTSERPDLVPAAGALTKWAERRKTAALHDLPRAWNKFSAADRPWD